MEQSDGPLILAFATSLPPHDLLVGADAAPPGEAGESSSGTRHRDLERRSRTQLALSSLAVAPS